MVNFQILIFLSVTLVATLGSRFDISSRISNGTPVETLQRFPWHVSIHNSNGPQQNCSGTILSNRWILTSSRCVKDDLLYEISFHRMYLNSFQGSFSLIVDKSSVVPYPTEYHALSLIKLPTTLEFTTELTAAKYTAVNLIDNSLVVMPGFGNDTHELTYGMFQLLSLKECKAAYSSKFDEYLQLCTKSWGFIDQVPCENNEGGGLIVGWPTAPQLIGVFTKADENCVDKSPAVYTNVLKYIDWINDVLRYM